MGEKLEDSGIDSAGLPPSQKSSPTTPVRSIMRQQSIGINLSVGENNHIEPDSSEQSSGTGGNTAGSSLNSQYLGVDLVGSSEKSFKLSEPNPEGIKSLSFGLPYSCALSDTVIFDKTDTLTAARMKVSRISTTLRDYGFLEEGAPDLLQQMLEDSRRNALKYLLTEEEDEEENRALDSDQESKSEDSQEGSESSQQ